ncbi:hypothetical protein BJX70DRAFT_17880 [Aspergillus crustosus]
MHPRASYPPISVNRAPKRRRVNVACSSCRSHKIRCGGIRPKCGTCYRRREQCSYPDGNDQSHNIETRRDENQGPHAGLELDKPSLDDDRFEPEATAMGLATRTLSDVDEPSDDFYGDSSAVAFIKSLQESLKPTTLAPETPPEPTPQNTAQTSASRGVSRVPRVSLDLLPPRALADHLVSCYFTKIHTLYPIIHKDAFLAAYEDVWISDGTEPNASYRGLGLGDPTVSDTTWYYALNIVFAMGCQFPDIVRTERQATSEAFFYRCKPALDVDYLERGDLAVVQVILLMSHYLQGPQTPNRC